MKHVCDSRKKELKILKEDVLLLSVVRLRQVCASAAIGIIVIPSWSYRPFEGMPLGLFGSHSKPQPLTSVDSGGYKEKKEGPEKDGRGTVLRLEKSIVTIEKKLAEGGFAIVYLVTDKNNRQYALKRQFINDDSKQVDACRREYQIVSSLKGHKNIVEYVDHLLVKNKTASVLQLMNDRLHLGQSFRSHEILSIFCDMCEAVARLKIFSSMKEIGQVAQFTCCVILEALQRRQLATVEMVDACVEQCMLGY
ncbi:hypothetical protein DICVIV_01141 [Dictyocaulus viviparus]|uniref:non-specific serine/threonine protein kinase n=1 Tax=Dictyocaulus viviparus TaxID=29172 RepID=A0A0D8Y7J9_DICVI|nr:hypothetical protein DICVIV_01141 [Dictyocaulus viviparus]